jgi:hypothetical protein
MYSRQVFFRSLLLSSSLLAAMSTAALAQTPTGTISGTVADASGATVTNAVVTVKSLDNGQTQTIKTDDSGRYLVPLLTPGQYSVRIEAPGFRPAQQDNITVEVSETHPVDFALSVGTDTQGVTVEATAPNLETSSSTTGQVITGKRILDLPLNGRNPFDLAALVPGVSTVGGASTPHIAGSRNANNEQELDGVSNILPENNVGNNSSAYQPIVDSVQEFNVQTSVLPPEYGRFSGGVINLATRTGTNTFHGSVFEFNRNQIFDAKDYFNNTQPKPDLSRNQIGGTIGGPLKIPHFYNGRDRTFYFFAYEHSAQTNSNTETDSVATARERTGDFGELLPTTQIYDPATATETSPGSGVYLRSPFPNNVIPADRLNAVGLAALSYQPLPNAPGLINNYNATGPSKNTYYHFDIRVDHQWTKAWHSFVRFSHIEDDSLGFADFPIPNASLGYNNNAASTAYSASYDNTFTITPTLLAEVRYGFSRSAVNGTPFGGNFDPTKLGLPGSIAAVANAQVFPRFNIGNGLSGIGGSGYQTLLENPSAHDPAANIIKIKGGHEMKFGVEYRKLFLNFHQYGEPSGEFDFDQTWTQKSVLDSTQGGGNPFAGLVLGLPSGGFITDNPTFATASTYLAFYGQDTWRATSKLTLNYGLRWDIELPRTERRNQLSYWNINDPSPLGSVTPGANVLCPACSSLKGAMHFVNSASGQYGRRQADAQKLDFGPRIGFAYSVDTNTVVRAGFGIVFAPSALQPAGTSGAAGTEGFSAQTNASFSFDQQRTINTTLSNPFPTGFVTPAGAAGGPGTDLGNGISDSFFASVRNPYSEQANLTVQRALPGNTVVEVGYLYNQGLHLIDGDPGTPYDQVNPSYLSLGSALTQSVANPFYGLITTPGSPLSQKTVTRNQLLRPFPQYNGVQDYRKPTAMSNYNAVTVRVDKRFAQGLSLLLSYTGAKLMDNSPAAVNYLGPVSTTYTNQYNPQGEYSVSPQDVNHQLVTTYTYELPFGSGRHFLGSAKGLTNTLVSGWQSSGIVSFIGGTPIVLGAATDNSQLFTEGQRPNMSNFNAKLSNPNRNEWFNTAVFSNPAPFTLGNGPRTLGNVRTPRLVNADLSAIKNTYFGANERYNAQFRFEAFNALNHSQLASPDTGVNDGNFGKITSQANTSRQVQLAVKFVF